MEKRDFLKPENRTWSFLDNVLSPFLSSSHQFGDIDFSIYLIDNFAGLQPLLNVDNLAEKEVQISFRPTAILDSNVVSSLVQLVNKDPNLLVNRKKTILELLQFFILNNIDYNPFFYFMEGAWKNQSIDISDYAEKVAHTIIKLHTMDNQQFLLNQEIITDPEQLKLYILEYEREKLEDIAHIHASAMILPIDPIAEGMSLLSYASLMKIALIHRTSNKSIKYKYREFRTFVEKTLNIAVGIERCIALGYFAGQFDKFLPLQKGSNYERTLAKIKASAWDLLLLRLPSRMLAHSDSEFGIVVGYICTCDKDLARIANSYIIRKILPSKKEHRHLPIVSFDMTWLYDYIDSDILHSILDEEYDWQFNRIKSLRVEVDRISFNALVKLVNDLEVQIKNFCNN